MVAGFFKQLLKEERKQKEGQKEKRVWLYCAWTCVNLQFNINITFTVKLLNTCQRVIIFTPRAKHKQMNVLMNKLCIKKNKKEAVYCSMVCRDGGHGEKHPPLDASNSLTVTLNLPRCTTRDTQNVRSHTYT